MERQVRPLRQSADFRQVLATAPRSRSAHFAIHHVAGAPTPSRPPAIPALPTELSTEAAPTCGSPVDESTGGWWLGTVVPKRHARRAVTRNLVRRQMRLAIDATLAGLPPGRWVLRLKAPFDRQRFVSAASPALRDAARAELRQLLARWAAAAAPAGASA